MDFSILVSILAIFAIFHSVNCQATEDESRDELLRRNIMSWVQKPVPVHQVHTQLKMMDEQGLGDEFYLDEKLARDQSTCKLVKIEKRLIMEGLVFRPEIVDEIYCINTHNPTAKTCPMSGMVCEQKRETNQISWRHEGQENCWKDPMPYEKPAGCHCYIQN